MTAILSTCLHNIEELDVQFCEITTRGFENFSAAISKSPNPVYYLFFDTSTNNLIL